MRTPSFAPVAVCVFALAAAALTSCGGAEESPPPSATASPTTAITQAPPADVVTGLVGERPLVSSDGKLEVRTSGPSALEVTIRLMKEPPGMPRGWTAVLPVYDVTARERGASVTELDQPLLIRFRSTDAATVMVYNGRDWLVTESDVADGLVTATVDHLTPYTVGKPAPVLAGPSVTPPSAGGSATVLPRATASTPPATASAAASVPAVDALPALEAAAARFKGKELQVSGAGGYDRVVSLPPLLQQALERAAALEGRLAYGSYGGVNEVFTTGAGGVTANGSLGFVIEQRTVYPATAREAQAVLVDLFPQAKGPIYSLQKSATGNFAFFALDNGTGYIVGFTQYQGITFAYAAAGSGNYAGIVAWLASNQ